MTEVRVVDDPAAGRFEADVHGQVAYLEYRLAGDTIDLIHTEVPRALEGQGIGSRLVRTALDSARERGLKVIVSCGFVRAYIKRHPEYQPLVVG